MKKREVLSKDSTWKIVVEAWPVNLFFYKAMGISTNVYERNSGFWAWLGAWKFVKASLLSVSGAMSYRLAPGFSAPLPGSPLFLSNFSKAECSIWVFGIGVKIKIDLIFNPSDPSTGGAPSLIADGLSGSGSATRKGETLATSTVSYP